MLTLCTALGASLTRYTWLYITCLQQVSLHTKKAGPHTFSNINIVAFPPYTPKNFHHPAMAPADIMCKKIMPYKAHGYHYKLNQIKTTKKHTNKINLQNPRCPPPFPFHI